MLRSFGTFLLALIIVAASVSQTASAIQSPVGCNSNRLTLSITRDKLTVQKGDLLTYTITLSNVNNAMSIACDIDNATIVATLPALDGTATGQTVTVASGASYPAGTPFGVVGTVPYTVNVNQGVTDAVAEVNVNGILHDAPTDHAADISKTIGTTVLWPTASTASVVTVSTPQSTPTPSFVLPTNLPGVPNTAVGF